ncbi:hypothetical protein OGAPHI_007333 [Ogataea philodendri]|uniref:G-protein coupled receptors family 1 profile domain-containing protein n=1 Tax=Ogataea philodendri TaxID=1378263 RepID=A0A9P8NTL7_9ASCO|nr:uncharacterized protein OGAPHI_007333 [Ogataea philodendri]KAH3660128.1 hypothetical protein OGAPHI_007333 [Ogataea philodendri]
MGLLLANLTSVYDLDRSEVLLLDLFTFIPGTLSMMSGFLSIYWYFNIHVSRKTFRHKLILYLMLGNTIRGCIHFIYPILSLSALSRHSYQCAFFTELHFATCDVFGYLLNSSFVCGDVIIIVTALHSLLLIIRPQDARVYRASKSHPWKGRLRLVFKAEKNNIPESLALLQDGYLETQTYTYRQEAGLYRYDPLILLGCMVAIPCTLSSFAFVDGSRYDNYISFCYLPANPVWIRILGSWGLRLFAFVIILVCYFTIYVYIYASYQKLSAHHERLLNVNKHKPRLQSLRAFLFGVYYSIFDISMKNQSSMFVEATPTNQTPMVLETDQNVTPMNSQIPQIHSDSPIAQTQRELAIEVFEKSVQDFNDRKKSSLRALKFIFIYPLTYMIVWVVPLIAQILRFRRQKQPLALLCVVSFFQSIDGLIQVLVFCFREKPWKLASKLQEQQPAPPPLVNSPASGNGSQVDLVAMLKAAS